MRFVLLFSSPLFRLYGRRTIHAWRILHVCWYYLARCACCPVSVEDGVQKRLERSQLFHRTIPTGRYQFFQSRLASALLSLRHRRRARPVVILVEIRQFSPSHPRILTILSCLAWHLAPNMWCSSCMDSAHVSFRFTIDYISTPTRC